MEPTESKLESFFHGMQYYLDVSREARQALASAVAESFSVFDYLQPDENLLSGIIADLLDPRGNHGQSNTFLACFLQRLIALGGHLKSGQTCTAQNRPKDGAPGREMFTVIPPPCASRRDLSCASCVART
jgi:hypothetical protein